jgi:hypothetical protein
MLPDQAPPGRADLSTPDSALAELPVFPFTGQHGLDIGPRLDRYRREDPVPVVRLASGGQAYLVTRYEDVKRVLADPLRSAGRPPRDLVPQCLPRRPRSRTSC